MLKRKEKDENLGVSRMLRWSSNILSHWWTNYLILVIQSNTNPSTAVKEGVVVFIHIDIYCAPCCYGFSFECYSGSFYKLSLTDGSNTDVKADNVIIHLIELHPWDGICSPPSPPPPPQPPSVTTHLWRFYYTYWCQPPMILTYVKHVTWELRYIWIRSV